VYLGASDALVLSREELVVSPFDNSGRRFGWLRPMVFPLKLRDFPRKRIGVLCVLIYYCCSYCETSLPRTEIVLGEERVSLLRGETVLGQERAKGCSYFLHIC
jgi:hypothetical protein